MKVFTPDLVSVIVPVYNAEKWLDACIQSIVQQKYQNLQIILINDGSCDRSEEICRRWAKNDSRIQYIYQQNSGVSEARNKGIDAAQGEFICFVDSDDWLEPHHISTLFSTLTAHRADMATSGYTKVYTKESKKAKILPPKSLSIYISSSDHESELVNLFASRLLYCPYAHLFKSSFIYLHSISFKKGMQFGEDRLFILDYLAHCSILATEKTSTYNYRIENPESLSNIKPEEVLLHEKIFFQANKKFIDALGFHNPLTLRWLYSPLFHAFIDDYFTNNKLTSFSQAAREAKKLTNDFLFCESLYYANTHSYSKLLIFLLKHKLNLLLALQHIINRKRA